MTTPQPMVEQNAHQKLEIKLDNIGVKIKRKYKSQRTKIHFRNEANSFV